MNKRILIFDPVPYKGGSKKVIQSILSTCPKNTSVFVVSNDRLSWQETDVRVLPLYCSAWLVDKTSGIGYFLKQIVYSLVLLYYFIYYGRFNKTVGISGPTVDFSLYLAKFIIHFDIVQLVQGDVPFTRLAGYLLKKADAVFYLTSTENSIKKSLKLVNSSKLLGTTRYQQFTNSVNPQNISKRKNNRSVGVLWAASILPWKRLDIFVQAFKALILLKEHSSNSCFGSVCFIAPNGSDVLIPDGNIRNFTYHQDPENLDEIRSTSSIFVSTSIREPFGLSILESMVAGLAIIIPKDGAYWDKKLTHGLNCMKFDPDNVQSLCCILNNLVQDKCLRDKVSNNGQKFAQRYTDGECYSRILKSIIK